MMSYVRRYLWHHYYFWKIASNKEAQGLKQAFESPCVAKSGGNGGLIFDWLALLYSTVKLGR